MKTTAVMIGHGSPSKETEDTKMYFSIRTSVVYLIVMMTLENWQV